MSQRPLPSTLFPYTTLFRSKYPGLSSIILSDYNLGAYCEIAHLRSEEHTSELQSLRHLVCRLLLEKKKSLRRSMESLPAAPITSCGGLLSVATETSTLTRAW